jgi:hypothetical protein
MTDHEIDTLVATANPIDEAALQALALDTAQLELCEAILRAAAEPEPELAPLAPRRRRRRPLLAAAAVAAIAIAALIVADGRDPGPSGTAWAAPLVQLAESSPLLLLDAPGWAVTRADEYGKGEGEMTFTRGGAAGVPGRPGSADLHWRAGPIAMWKRDRSHDSPLVVERTVLGERAQISQYRGSTDFAAIWPDGSRVLEFRAVTADLKDFEQLLAALKRVDVDAWLSAMPPSVVKAADRSGVVREMLADVPLPPRFDLAPLERRATLSHRYQLGAQVTGAVTCAWIDRWAAARKRGDDATAAAAAAAMQTSHRWKILKEMESQGAWSEVLWERADAMRDRGSVPEGGSPKRVPLQEEVRSSLGCGVR